MRTETLRLIANLRSFGAAPALIDASGPVSYRALDQVDAAIPEFGDGRRLVGVALANDVDSVVRYLAALAAGHAVVLGAPCRLDQVAAGVAPSVIADDQGIRVDAREHDLHPDLALLLSTSGSTGSAKLVRLSYDNVQSNADAIAEYLAIRPTDRAITTLPLHYCYGLSVLHSHLSVGAAIVLTDASVTDADFGRLMAGVTTLPGVPHTFDLLERIDFQPPATLRTVTQAGGRMPPQAVRRWAERGQAHGFDFFVMYGQTEATARMLYLPPDLALTHPGAVGVPIPGGEVRIDYGELVYAGPNVMLGYATSPADLARGRDLAELRTGDLARINEAGLVEIVGRQSRFAKLFGVRVDLAGIEAELAAAGQPVWCQEGEGCLLAACLGDPDDITQRLCQATGLPRSAVTVQRIAEVPRTPSGKPDYPALKAAVQPPTAAPTTAAPTTPAAVLAATLALDPDTIEPTDTFVTLGGDSLSYVATAAALERLLGTLPADWHTTAVGDLRPAGATGPAQPRHWRRMDTTAVLRAVAIVAVVASHIGVIDVRGGAHLLVAIAGFNFARFRLHTGAARGAEVEAALVSTARIAVPAGLYLALVALLSGEYGASLVFGINLFGPDERSPEWRYWYLEAFLAVLLVAIMAVAVGHRTQRRRPFAFAMGTVAVGLVLRFALAAEDGPGELYTPVVVGWLFAVGWALAEARQPWQRAVVAAALALGMVGYFDEFWRAAFVLLGVAMVALLPSVAVPARAVPVIAAVASASLWIYLTHWQVFPVLDGSDGQWGWLALPASLGVGIAAYWLDQAVQRRIVRA